MLSIGLLHRGIALMMVASPVLVVAQSAPAPNIKRFFRTKPAPAVDSGFGTSLATNGALFCSRFCAFDLTTVSCAFMICCHSNLSPLFEVGRS
jgi:hypothetical protein